MEVDLVCRDERLALMRYEESASAAHVRDLKAHPWPAGDPTWIRPSEKKIEQVYRTCKADLKDKPYKSVYEWLQWDSEFKRFWTKQRGYPEIMFYANGHCPDTNADPRWIKFWRTELDMPEGARRPCPHGPIGVSASADEKPDDSRSRGSGSRTQARSSHGGDDRSRSRHEGGSSSSSSAQPSDHWGSYTGGLTQSYERDRDDRRRGYQNKGYWRQS